MWGTCAPVIGLLILLPCNVSAKRNYRQSSFYLAVFFSSQLCFFPTDQAEGIAFQDSSHPQIITHNTRVDFKCEHDDEDKIAMLWYQQTGDGLMNLIGFNYMGSMPVYTREFSVGFEITRETMQKGALIIHAVTQSDTAVYYCAASAQWRGLQSPSHQNLVVLCYFGESHIN